MGKVDQRQIWSEHDLTPEEKRDVDQMITDYRTLTFDLRGFRGQLIRAVAVGLIKSGWRKQQ